MKRVLAISGVLTAVVMAGLWNVSATATAAQQQSLTAKFGPHKQANLPPLPFGPRDPLPRPPQVVAQVFQFAAEHPEVLSYIPCFCGCDHAPLGHRGNDDCFVKQRAANGDVVEWEPHGTECQVCIDVGQQSMQMYSSGASVSQIRTAIEQKYAGKYQSHTPTPQPPAKVAPAPAKK
jgi:hypothetical protein